MKELVFLDLFILKRVIYYLESEGSGKEEDEDQRSDDSESESEYEDNEQDTQTQSEDETGVGLKSLLEDLSGENSLENKVSFSLNKKYTYISKII